MAFLQRLRGNAEARSLSGYTAVRERRGAKLKQIHCCAGDATQPRRLGARPEWET
jgi:hypothetical protein